MRRSSKEISKGEVEIRDGGTSIQGQDMTMYVYSFDDLFCWYPNTSLLLPG